MAAAKATNNDHEAFWASGEPDERVALIAEMAANIREDAAPEPSESEVAYDSKARGAELLIAAFVGTRGLIKSATAGSGVKVDFETRDEAMALASQAMGPYAVGPEVPSGPANAAFISRAPF